MLSRPKWQKEFDSKMKFQLREFKKQLQADLSPREVNEKVNEIYANKDSDCSLFMVFLVELMQHHGTQLKLSKKAMQHFLKNNLLHLEPVKNCLQAIALGDADSLRAYQATVSGAIQHCMAEAYSPSDRRHVENTERPIRRMTSIANIFRLMKGLSVCNAATIHNGELILSFNMSYNDKHNDVMKFVQAKIAILEAHFQYVSTLTKVKYQACHETLSRQVFQELLAAGGNALKHDRGWQALDKVTDALFFDPQCPIPELKQLFQDGKLRCRILLPLVNDDNDLQIMCDDQLYPTSLKTNDVSTAHCEQILAYYLFVIKQQPQDPNNPMLFGITKLCCQSCRHNLKELPVIVSGSHGEYEEKTLCFFKDNHEFVATAVAPGTPRAELTHQPESPPSAKKRRDDEIEIEDLADRTHKRFVFSSGGLFGSTSNLLDHEDDDEMPDNNASPTKKGRFTPGDTNC